MTSQASHEARPLRPGPKSFLLTEVGSRPRDRQLRVGKRPKVVGSQLAHALLLTAGACGDPKEYLARVRGKQGSGGDGPAPAVGVEHLLLPEGMITGHPPGRWIPTSQTSFGFIVCFGRNKFRGLLFALNLSLFGDIFLF